ncbi:MAG: hypothetical protein ACFFCW_42280 [Candidatus Hodarchaeota archaeon]
MAKKAKPKDIEHFLQDSNRSLYDRFIQLKGKSVNDLAPRQQRVDDTGAAGYHYASVHRIVDNLVPTDKLQNYKAIEAFILLSAIHLHDVGKICPKGKVEKHHANKGVEAVISVATELNLSEPEAIAIGYVIQAHGPDPIGRLEEVRGIFPFGEVRIRYFGALLRLADDLDMCFTRAPRISQKLASPGKEIVGKWNLRRCVDNVTIDPQTWTIEVQATPHTTEEYSMLLREVESLNARLTEARPYLHATPDIGLYYKILDVRTDARWLNRLASQEKPANEELTNEPHELKTPSLAIPQNAAVVIAWQDPISSREYTQIVAPCLRKAGYTPFLIEDIPPSGSLVSRVLDTIKASKLVLGNVSETAAPSIHFRLGVAAGLQKELILYSSERATIAGDCSGMRVLVYKDAQDLKRKLVDLLSSLER